MEAFFNELTDCIKLCINILNQENDTRNDPILLLQIYNADAEVARSSQRATVAQITEGKLKLAIDSMTKQKKNTKSMQAFLTETFHRFDVSEFYMHILYTDIEKGLNNGLDETEALLWKDHPELVPAIRLIIAHFDELEPQGQFITTSQKYKINGPFLAYFMDWCLITGTGNESVFVENYFNKHYHGQCLTLKANSVNSAKNHSCKNHRDLRAEMNQKIEQLLAKYEKDEQRKRNEAVNF